MASRFSPTSRFTRLVSVLAATVITGTLFAGVMQGLTSLDDPVFASIGSAPA